MSPHRCVVCGSIVPPGASTCRVCGTPAAAGLVSAALAEAAPVRRRVVAALIDQLPVLLLVAAGITLLALGTGWWWAPPAAAGVWIVLLWWWSVPAGSSPGKHWLGLAVVRQADGGPPDLWPALGRLAVRGGLCLFTVGVAGMSYRWDPDGREHTWWDRICGTRVTEAPAAGSERASAAAVVRWAPEGSAPAGPATLPGGAGGAGAGAGAGGATPVIEGGVLPPPFGAGDPHEPTVPAAPVLVAVGVPAPAPITSVPPGAVPASLPGPVPAPPPNPTRRSPSADQAEFLSRPLVGDPSHAVPAVPASASDTSPVGLISRVPSAGGTEAAGSRLPATGPSDVLGSGPPARRPAAEMVWDTGRTVLVAGRVLVGRDPTAAPGEDHDELLAVTTDSVGVSKTHLQLDVTAAGVTVTDRHSTNGVRVIRSDGTVESCPPGVAVGVGVGDVVHFGGRSLTRAR
jgi:hypothetical protein